MDKKSVWGMWKILKNYQKYFIIAAISLSIAALSHTLKFIILQNFIDDITISGFDTMKVLLFSLLIIGLSLIQGGTTFIKGKCASYSTEQFILKLRNFLFDHIQKLPFSYHDKTHSGEIIERVTSDVETLQKFYSIQATEIGKIGALFLFNFIVLINLNWIIGLISIIFIPAILAISIWFFRKIFHTYELCQKQEAIISSQLQENLSAVRIVKTFANQSFEEDKFNKENMERYKRGKANILLHSYYWPVTDILSVLQILLVTGVGAYFVINSTITLGTYIAAMSMVAWIIWPIRNLGQIILEASAAYVSFGRIADIVNEKPEVISDSILHNDTNIKGEIKF